MPAPVHFKATLLDHCQRLVGQKEASLLKTLEDISDSLRNETKSTAGDKYETARAMLHIEQANTNRQLQEAGAQIALLDQADINITSKKIISGSLIKTDKGAFFICAAIGKVVVDGITVFVLSAKSPLGNCLMGCETGDRVSVNGADYLIKEIE